MRSEHPGLVHAQLGREGITVHKLQRLWWSRAALVPAREVAALTRQWATLLQAGISMVPALKMLERSTSVPGLARTLAQVRQALEDGQPLSRALESHPDTFSPLYVSLVQAGEAGGILDHMMSRLADSLEKNEALRTRLRSALTYPAVVTSMAALALAVILLYVVPVFEEVFTSFGGELPTSTRIIVGLSQALRQGTVWAAALALPALWLLRREGHRRGWQRRWHRQVLEWPVVGDLIRTSVTARWAHTLSALLAAGVPLSEALPVAGKASGHPVYERVNQHLQRRVIEGGKLSEGMAHTERFPEMLVAMCAVGEETGALQVLLARASELMTAELETRLQTLTTLIEPLIVVVLGSVIGVILVALYLPIFRLGQVF